MGRITVIAVIQMVAAAMYRYLNKITRGVFGILIDATQEAFALKVGHSAAAIAYYALFSLFPLTLFLITIASYFLDNQQVQEQILRYTDYFLPLSQQLVQQNIEQLLELRHTVGPISTVVLLWSATSIFAVLMQSINSAWHTAPPRNFLKERLIAFVLLSLLAFILTGALIATTVLSLIVRLELPGEGQRLIQTIINLPIVSVITSWALLFAAFLLLYKYIPNTDVRWVEAVWGAAAATIGWELTKEAFTWYLTTGLSRYQIIYGSLGAVVAFMLWGYISSWILLMGAGLSAAIGRHHRHHYRADVPPRYPLSKQSGHSILSGEETAKLILSSFTVAIVIAEADTEAGRKTLASVLAAMKDMFISPSIVKKAFDEFQDRALLREIMAHKKLYEEALYQMDVDAYMALPWNVRLRELAHILDSKLPPEKATILKQFLLDLGERIACQSGGGFWGFEGEKSPHEAKKLADIGTILNVAPSTTLNQLRQ